MTDILDFLKIQREECLPIVKSLFAKQREQYARLTPQFAELLDHLEAYILKGGKWHRPALGILAYQLAGGTKRIEAQRTLVGLEILHRYILAHDDVIDRDLMRHGGPTIEKIYADNFMARYPSKKESMYGKGMAIIAGDMLHSMAYNHVLSSQFSEDIRIQVVKNMARLKMETAAGWQLQTHQNYQSIAQVTEAEFFSGMQLVSAQYSIVWPLRIGQILAGRVTAESWDPALDEYGWHTGAAFQIMDDVLGMFGQPETTGKPVGHDYREGKKTFLVLHAFAHASAADQQFLIDTLGTDIDATVLHRVQDIMRQTGSLDYSKEKAQNHAALAKAALASLKSPLVKQADLLAQLADFLAHREF